MERVYLTEDEAGAVLTVLVQFMIDTDLDTLATTPDDVETSIQLSGAYRKIVARVPNVDFNTLSEACAAIRAELMCDAPTIVAVA